MTVSQTVNSKLKQMFVLTLLVAGKCKLYEIYRRMDDANGEAYFIQKIFTTALSMGLLRRVGVKKIGNGVETHWISGKKK